MMMIMTMTMTMTTSTTVMMMMMMMRRRESVAGMSHLTILLPAGFQKILETNAVVIQE